jgi:hypothetical protein
MQKGGCCRKMFFENLSPVHLDVLTPPGTFVVEVPQGYLEIIEDRMKTRLTDPDTTTVYVSPSANQGKVDAVIDGLCANVDSKGNCRRYLDRPPHCKNLQVASSDCTDVRRSLGLPPVRLPMPTFRRKST